MEDQSTDTSDLTNDGPAEPKSAATPVGKRGRHRSFRPRPVAPPQDATTADAPETAEEATEPTAVDDAEPTAVFEDAPEAAVDDEPKAKRRRWFRRRSAAAPEAVEETEDTAVEVADEEPVELVPRKPAGKKLTIAVAVAAALFVAAGAFGGAMLEPYLSDRVVAATKHKVAQTATDAITTLFTYTPDDMDQLPERSAKYLGGDLGDSYAKQVDALAATNKQNQIRRSAQVVGAAVESLNGGDATAVVYANITYTSAANKDVPRIFLVSYRLTMKREGSNWVITNMPWITSKDLTRVTP